MQRRATALWAVLLIVLSVGAYAFIGVAQEPVLMEDPDHRVSDGESIQLGGEEYTYSAENGELTFHNETARSTETVENESDFEYRNQSYTVLIPNETDPSSFTLRHALPDDVETVTVNESDYVVVEQEGERRLVEPDQYIQDRFGNESSYDFSEGDQLEYDGNPSTVASVTQDDVTITWDDPGDETLSVEEGTRLTFDGTEYVASVPSDGTLELGSDVDGYERQVDLHESYRERINGLWAIAIIGGLSAITLIGLAYMPSRY